MSKTTFALMYPGSLNLHGENYSALAFENTAHALGKEITVQAIANFATPLPQDANIWFFGPGELTTLKRLLPALKSQKNAFEEHLNRGGYVVVVGNTGAIFGKTLSLQDGTVLEGLGLLDMTISERKMIKAEDLIFETPLCPHPLCGYQNMRYDFETSSPLGKVIHGWGNCNRRDEGAVGYDGHMIFTNAMGPFFVKNPWFTKSLLNSDIELSFNDEENAYQSLKKYIDQKPHSETLL